MPYPTPRPCDRQKADFFPRNLRHTKPSALYRPTMTNVRGHHNLQHFNMGYFIEFSEARIPLCIDTGPRIIREHGLISASAVWLISLSCVGICDARAAGRLVGIHDIPGSDTVPHFRKIRVPRGRFAGSGYTLEWFLQRCPSFLAPSEASPPQANTYCLFSLGFVLTGG